MAAANYTTGTIAVVTGCLGVHGVYASAAVIPHITAICACGAIVSASVTMFTYKEDKSAGIILSELKTLDKKIGELSHKMDALFGDLKSYMATSLFYMNEVATIKTLMQYMQHTMNNPCKYTKGLFEDAVKRHPPLWIAEQMIIKLDQEETNPLKMAMNGDPLRRKETFEKWRKIIDGVLAQCLFLETYQNGMFCDKNMSGPNRLAKQLKELPLKMDRWADEYRRDHSYWDVGVLNLIHNVQDNNQGSALKRTTLTIELGKIMTNHKFYVFVYDACDSSSEEYAITSGHCSENNIKTSLERNGCNVIVFRSFRTQDCKRHEEDLQRKLQAALPMEYAYRFHLNMYAIELCKRFGDDCGLVLIIRLKNTVYHGPANCYTNEYSKAPGACLNGFFEKTFLGNNYDRKWFYIFAGVS